MALKLPPGVSKKNAVTKAKATVKKTGKKSKAAPTAKVAKKKKGKNSERKYMSIQRRYDKGAASGKGGGGGGGGGGPGKGPSKAGIEGAMKAATAGK